MPIILDTPAVAIVRANALTGLDAIAKSPTATRTKVIDDVTPFLGERNEGKTAWRVEYPQASLSFPSAALQAHDRFRRTFVVTLDAATGVLWSVVSTSEGKPDPDMRPMPPCGVATHELSQEEEVYDGYPADDPKITFLAALECILNGGVGSPFLAKAIHGAYVLHSRTGSPPRAVWAITLRGLPPLPVRHPVPVWQRNHMRNVVDATTGQVLFATNSPQPQ